jgi:hypothetical protein
MVRVGFGRLLWSRTHVRYGVAMTTPQLEHLRWELESERRSLAMLSPAATVSRDNAMALIERCQRAIDAALRIG